MHSASAYISTSFCFNEFFFKFSDYSISISFSVLTIFLTIYLIFQWNRNVHDSFWFQCQTSTQITQTTSKMKNIEKWEYCKVAHCAWKLMPLKINRGFFYLFLPIAICSSIHRFRVALLSFHHFSSGIHVHCSHLFRVYVCKFLFCFSFFFICSFAWCHQFSQNVLNLDDFYSICCRCHHLWNASVAKDNGIFGKVVDFIDKKSHSSVLFFHL